MGYYLYLITSVSEVAEIGNNKIYKIEDTHILKLFSPNDNQLKRQEEKLIPNILDTIKL